MIVSPLTMQHNSRISAKRHMQLIVIQRIQRITKLPNCGHTPTKSIASQRKQSPLDL